MRSPASMLLLLVFDIYVPKIICRQSVLYTKHLMHPNIRGGCCETYWFRFDWKGGRMAPIGVWFRMHDITAASARKRKWCGQMFPLSLYRNLTVAVSVTSHRRQLTSWSRFNLPSKRREKKRENNCELKRLAVTIFPFSISMMIPSDYTIRNIYISFEWNKQ